MHVLITGATGFVGGRIARWLRARGDAVTAIVRSPAPGLTELGVRPEPGGLDAVTPGTLADVDAVVHAAAVAGPDLATARRVNLDGTRHLLAAAVAVGTPRFVHVSTTSVYDLERTGDREVGEDAALVGNDPSDATDDAPSPYSLTKAEAEGAVTEAIGRGLSGVILRPPAVLGAGRTSTWGTRVPGRVRDGEAVPLHPEATFGWVHVDDLVEATGAALDSRAIATLNVVGGHVPAGTYLHAVHELFPTAPPIAGGGRIWRGRYATDRLPAELGFQPSRSFETAMDEIRASWADGDPAGWSS
jgi:2-alkyl-3-oxoalkanoate reductase